MSSQASVLVVEDDVDINNLLYKILMRNGYLVQSAYSGTEAKLRMEHENYDLLLLDLMLPGQTGEELICEIRKEKYMPIIVISAKVEQENKIYVLNLGADDFICKPFDIEEVLARVAAQIRRYKQFPITKENHNEIHHKNLILHKDSRLVLVKGKEIALTVREFDILELFLQNKNKVFTRENLFKSIWQDEFLGDYNTVNVHVSNLRNKLSKVDEEEYIQTVWGIGFKLKE